MPSYTITMTVEVPEYDGFSEAVFRRVVCAELREAVEGRQRGAVTNLLIDHSEVT